MNIIQDIFGSEGKIKDCILRYGRLPQHYYYLFLNYNRKGERHIFFDFGAGKGIFGYQKGNVWRVLTDPIAPEKDKEELIIDAISEIFKKGKARKIILEDISEGLTKKIFLRSKKEVFWRAVKPSYSSVWPIIDLKNWNPALPGKDWKRLRNIKNKFFKDNRVEIKKASSVSKKDLKRIILKWKEGRSAKDRIYHPSQYLKFTDSGFVGCDITRIIIVNGLPVSIAGGWKIPNSRNYYSVFGIFDYDCQNISEISYLDELADLKQKRYQKVDLGGSEENLLAFKMKFHPDSFYKTYTFSVFKKQQDD